MVTTGKPRRHGLANGRAAGLRLAMLGLCMRLGMQLAVIALPGGRAAFLAPLPLAARAVGVWRPHGTGPPRGA